MNRPACEAFAVQAALDLWTDRGFACLTPGLFLDTLGSDLRLPSDPAARLLTELRDRIAARYLADLGREPEAGEWEAIACQANEPVRAAACRTRVARIRAKFWDVCGSFMSAAEFGAFWTTGRLPRPIHPTLDDNLVAARLRLLQEIEAAHLELLERPPTEAERAAILDPAAQLFTLPDGAELPKPAAADFFPELAAAFGGTLARRELLHFANTRTLPPGFQPTAEQLDAAILRLDLMTETLTKVRQAPPVLKDWLALYQLTWPPAKP